MNFVRGTTKDSDCFLGNGKVAQCLLCRGRREDEKKWRNEDYQGYSYAENVMWTNLIGC